MSLGSEVTAAALDAINQFGRSVTYNRNTNGNYNTATSTFSQSTASVTINAIIEEQKDTGKDPSLAAVSNRKMTAAATSFAQTPTLVDTVQIGTSTYIIDDIDIVTLGNVVVLYVFQLRKG